MNVSLSILLYRTPVQSAATKSPYRTVEMATVQRKAALRCVNAYRIVSTETICVLARTMPIDVLEQRSAKYVARKKAKTKQEAKRAEIEIRQSWLEN